ncbi:J domain-containing protein [Tissierella carlieri]|uniref:J domain-containing protein n=1 Tax=Tissierella carlieri TaxID=689904 RepID=A0ABT1SF15_9FIRM|nr:J domain-containing protein [Tissierella carlieri]
MDYFGLTPGASIDDIKKKFRELAKKYHPDHGGSSEKMIEVLDTYHKLMNKD